MVKRIWMLVVLSVIFAAYVSAAESPFAGSWKLNPAKSKFTGETVRYETAPAGMIRETASGISYTFKTDGKEYAGPFDRKVAWTQKSDRSWESVYKFNGKTLVTSTTQLSPDAKTMTVNSKGTKPNGEAFAETVVYDRIAGTTGLLGTWKNKEVKISSPSELRLTQSGADGLKFEVVDYKVVCDAKFDGKDYPATGPTVPPNFTLSLRRTGPRSFEMTEKQAGKPWFLGTYAVSADGKTLTEVTRPIAVNEPITAVYDRQ
jgi:hypothetical protein